MTEKKEPVQIVAKFVKISGVMVFLEEPGKEEYALPADLKILKVIKDSDKIHPGDSYTWKIVEDAKGQRSILTAGPADQEEGFKPASQLPREDSKAILQKNLDAKKNESKPAMAKTQAEINVEKEAEESRQRIAEHEAYLKQLAEEKTAKEAQKAIAAQKASPAEVTVIEPEVVKETVSLAVREVSGITPKTYTDDDLMLIRNIAAKNCTEPEFKLLMYMARTYGLDPLVKQIWAVKRQYDQPALIFAGRDGFLALAHRSGHFDGMQSGVNYEGEGKDKKPVSAWCEIWRNDMHHSFKSEVPFSEYNTGFSVWKTNPSAMILKVAEAVCLRKAFSIDGIYSPEEINTEQ